MIGRNPKTTAFGKRKNILGAASSSAKKQHLDSSQPSAPPSASQQQNGLLSARKPGEQHLNGAADGALDDEEIKRRQLESKLEWEELFDHEEMRKRRREAATMQEVVDYDDMDSSDDGDNLGKKSSKTKGSSTFGNGYAANLVSAFEASAKLDQNLNPSEKSTVTRLADEREGDQDAGDHSDSEIINKKPDNAGPVKKKLGIRGGNRETKKAKKLRKKAEKKRAAEEKKGKKDEEPDRYKKLLVQGEAKTRSIDTKRLCNYTDRDAPEDLRKKFGGDFRGTVLRQDEMRAASIRNAAASSGKVPDLMDYDDL